MPRFATIANWVVGCALAAALMLAPIVPAFAACPSVKVGMDTSASAPPMPCDTPCDDCSSDPTKKSCAGECVCAPLIFAFAAPLSPDRFEAGRLSAHSFAVPVGLTRPPDTPPPKLFA